MVFEKGIQTRNPNRSNAKYKLSKVIKNIDYLKTAFAVYEMFEEAQAQGEKLENFKVAKALGIKVESKIEDEANSKTINLYLRGVGDFREDPMVKSYLYDQILAKGFKPKLVFEDRSIVVKMWRGRGLRCLQVAEGDF